MAEGDDGDLVDRFLLQSQELGVGKAFLNSLTRCVRHRSILPDHSRNKSQRVFLSAPALSNGPLEVFQPVPVLSRF